MAKFFILTLLLAAAIWGWIIMLLFNEKQTKSKSISMQDFKKALF